MVWQYVYVGLALVSAAMMAALTAHAWNKRASPMATALAGQHC